MSGFAALLALSWLVDHPTLTIFTTQYDFDFADLYGRLANLHHLQSTGNIYVPFGVQAFSYPPGAIFFFWPILWVPSMQLPLLWNAASLLALVGVFVCVLDYLFQRALLLTVGISAWAAALSAITFPPIIACFEWGQTATILLLMVVLDLIVLRGSAKGVLVGVATAVKLYPGLFIIVWLLRREWRAAFTAIGAFAIITGAACVIWSKSASTFLAHVLIGGEVFQRLAGGSDALSNYSFAAIFLRSPFHVGFLNTDGKIAACAFVLILSLISAQRLWRLHFEFSSFVVLLIASVIGTPIAWVHYFSFAPLLLLMPFELGFQSPLARTSVVAGVTMFFPWFLISEPVHNTAWTAIYIFVGKNALVFASLSVILASFRHRTARQPVHLVAT